MLFELERRKEPSRSMIYLTPVIAVILTMVVGALVFMFIFMKIVYLSLPIGRPPFAEVSLALMQLMGIR